MSIKRIGFAPNKYGKATPVFRESNSHEKFIYTKIYGKKRRVRKYF